MYFDLPPAEVRGKDYTIPAVPRHLLLKATIAKDMKRIDDPSEDEDADGDGDSESSFLQDSADDGGGPADVVG